ncbi:MAG: bifunctional riboflavin kinase/FAD synthetase [Ignavibacteriaceae bacterium]|nr:bifunctional riboflavin kinase/FAD synthetase [Ignavibacteriaceae bacterium]
MKIIKDLTEIDRDEKSVITLGTFDGLHLGHQQIVDTVINKSLQSGGRSFLITFDPHPRKVIPGRNDVKILSDLEEKFVILEELGLENLFVINFTEEFSRQSPEGFVEKYLVKGIGLSEIVIGYDHHFGKERDGNFKLLQDLGQKFKFIVTVVPELSVGGETVSSTKIRNALLSGDVVKAGKMLGRPYSFKGKVVRGDGRGKKLGFPTANLSTRNEDKLIPAKGIYAAECKVENEKHFGLLSLGSRPTFHNDGDIIPEFYIFDFDKDIYDKIMQVNVVERIRDEQKFGSVEKLIIQMKKDEKSGREILSKLIN